MNPYAILGAVVLWGASVAGSFFYGQAVGKDGEVAKQAAINQAIIDTRKAAQEGAANAIAQIKVTNTTIRGRTDTIIRNDPVYVDCRHSDIGVRNINEALTGKPGAASDSKLPGTDATERQQLRRDNF
jgi:uncharacterized protein (UPF0333 family)